MNIAFQKMSCAFIILVIYLLIVIKFHDILTKYNQEKVLNVKFQNMCFYQHKEDFMTPFYLN